MEPNYSPYNEYTNYNLDSNNELQQHFHTVNFPIDLVYTWVNGDDPNWQAQRNQYYQNGYPPDATDIERWRNMNELYYSIESVFTFAPWIRNVYVVTDNQIPEWYNPDESPNIIFVDHFEIFPSDYQSDLPTFNSHAIECHLHCIPGLSEHFIYANDDCFMGNFVDPTDFFTEDGKFNVFFQSTPLPRQRENMSHLSASYNNNVLLQGVMPNKTFFFLKHQMKPMRKTAAEFAWTNDPFQTALRQTSTHRFRALEDYDPMHLFVYVGLLMGLAQPSEIESIYFYLEDAQTVNQKGVTTVTSNVKKVFGSFTNLLRKHKNLPQLYCINDTLKYANTRQLETIEKALQHLLPHRSEKLLGVAKKQFDQKKHPEKYITYNSTPLPKNNIGPKLNMPQQNIKNTNFKPSPIQNLKNRNLFNQTPQIKNIVNRNQATRHLDKNIIRQPKPSTLSQGLNSFQNSRQYTHVSGSMTEKMMKKQVEAHDPKAMFEQNRNRVSQTLQNLNRKRNQQTTGIFRHNR